jgi:SLIT-ROBO Rho GTPase activating protein
MIFQECTESSSSLESDLETLPVLEEELEQRMCHLDRRLSTLRTESNELWKTLETAEKSLLSLISGGDCSEKVKEWFVGTGNKEIHTINNHKQKCDRIELEQFHINVLLFTF